MTGTKTTNPAGSPVLSRAESPVRPGEFDGELERFKSLASKLVHVPKTEVDEKRKER